jgi:hypothetical protein
LAGECINIGVIVLGEGEVASRFVTEWARIECFAAGNDTSFLKAFAERIQDTDPTQLSMLASDGLEALNEEGLAALGVNWINSIQLTPLRTAALTPDLALDVLVPRFLPTHRAMAERAGRGAGGRPRQTAARFAALGLDRAVRNLKLAADVKKRAVLTGSVETHLFDAAVVNGQPYGAAHGLSFETAGRGELLHTVDAIGLAISDVRDRYPGFPIGIVGLRSKRHEKSPAFLRAVSLFGAYGAALLHEDEVEGWATDALGEYTREKTNGLWYQQLPGASAARAIAETLREAIVHVERREFLKAVELVEGMQAWAGGVFEGVPSSVSRGLSFHFASAVDALKAHNADAATYEMKRAEGLVAEKPDERPTAAA